MGFKVATYLIWLIIAICSKINLPLPLIVDGSGICCGSRWLFPVTFKNFYEQLY